MNERKPVFSPQRILDERDELKDALFDMVGQFAYEGRKNNKIVLHTGGLSSLEIAFKALRLSDPITKKDFEDRLNACGLSNSSIPRRDKSPAYP
jgi:hypothetical protein